ncbi:MAG: DMT family transporter [Chloroflexota bacterium]|nr:DMT family transporter [Chloroflexota bacterium]
MKSRDVVLLFVLGAIWGASYLFIRIAAPVLRPFPLVFIRLALGGGALFVYALITHRTIPWRANWKKYAIIGALNCALPFALISTAALNLTASFSSMLNATTPLFTAVVAALWLKDALTLNKIIGLALGLTGVAIIVGWQPTPLDSAGIFAAILLLIAALSYATGTVYGRSALTGSDSYGNAVGQLLLGGVWIFPFAVTNPPQMTPTVSALAAVLMLGLLSTSVAYLIYFRLLASVGATATASVTFLVPFFSSLWGMLILGEEIYLNEIIGFGIILVGLTLVTGLLARRHVEVAVVG